MSKQQPFAGAEGSKEGATVSTSGRWTPVPWCAVIHSLTPAVRSYQRARSATGLSHLECLDRVAEGCMRRAMVVVMVVAVVVVMVIAVVPSSGRPW